MSRVENPIVALILTLATPACFAQGVPPNNASSTQLAPPIGISLDGAALGRTFEGLGAVSGGGNSSRLLPDYPNREKSEILDYLFKPNFGASLSVLKVEVGGDINSTQGSEPSHMHTRGDENYTRGFEWWLMDSAKARNSKIALDCLAWGAPGWVGDGNYWSADMMDYYIKFIKGAKRYHGLDISSVGGRNEKGYDANWYIGFRKALDANGLSNVKLVGSDDWGPGWLNLAKESLTNPELEKSVDAFAGHVTWSENPGVPSQAILDTGKPLWDTELHNYLQGFDAEISLIHAINQNYIDAKITKNLTWYVCWSTYPESSYPDVGLIRANSPWSAHYDVTPVLWGYAHVNQFARPGWRFIEKGGNGVLPQGGTYTTLEAPIGGDYSIIAETKGAAAPQTVRFALSGGLSNKAVHVWSSTKDRQFFHLCDIAPSKGGYSLVLNPDAIYTISTTKGQHKGRYPASPPEASLSLPYSDTYQSYAMNAQARYHFDYEGSFEIAAKSKGSGVCLRQDATKSPSGWGPAYQPLTFLGSSTWNNYSIAADVYIEESGAVSVHGRIHDPGDGSNDPAGYTFRVHDNGAWELKSYKTVIASGTTGFSANQWHKLKLSFFGSNVTAYADGKEVASVANGDYTAGLAGLGTGWNFAQFSDLQIDPVASGQRSE